MSCSRTQCSDAGRSRVKHSTTEPLRSLERSSGTVRTACDIQIDRRRVGRPKLTWKKLTEKDCCEWKLMTVDLKKGAPGDQVQDLLCVQLASYLKGAH